MKLNVKVNDKTYAVEIEDLNARPIVAIVEGTRVEVMPERGEPLRAGKEASAEPAKVAKSVALPSDGRALVAPLPGTVTEIFVKVGDEIESGQVVLVIEAMKMKNSIRSPRAGKVAAVLATAGQIVTHKQTLVEFE
ncbi:MAG: biotin/lipoyl-containing protein [Chloroflexota bacterium]